jgi:Membrane protein involved in the export of O-antigen and teichoic acid
MLYGFGLQSFLIVFAVRLISYTDTTVIGVMLGTASVALYALPSQLVDYSRSALGSFASVFLPRLAIMSANGDLASLRVAFLQNTRIAAGLAAFLLTNLSFLATPFLSLWVGPEFATDVQWVVVSLAGATLLHVFITIVPLPFYQAMHLLAFPARVLMVEAGANLILSIVFARWIGLNGVALATILPTFFVSFLIVPRYLCRALALPVRRLLTESVLPAMLLGFAVAATHLLFEQRLPVSSYATLLARGALTLPAAVATALVLLSRAERDGLLVLIKQANRRVRVGGSAPS